MRRWRGYYRQKEEELQTQGSASSQRAHGDMVKGQKGQQEHVLKSLMPPEELQHQEVQECHDYSVINVCDGEEGRETRVRRQLQ